MYCCSFINKLKCINFELKLVLFLLFFEVSFARFRIYGIL